MLVLALLPVVRADQRRELVDARLDLANRRAANERGRTIVEATLDSEIATKRVEIVATHEHVLDVRDLTVTRAARVDAPQRRCFAARFEQTIRLGDDALGARRATIRVVPPLLPGSPPFVAAGT